jgi:16S rRNA processing protein RimM
VHTLSNNDLPEESSREIIVATVGAPHGLMGWAKLWPANKVSVTLSAYRRFRRVDGHPCELNVLDSRPNGSCWLFRFEGITNRAEAGELTGAELAVSRADLPVLEQGEFYWHDLIGLRVINQQGEDLGRVSRLLETGANDVLVVTGFRERYLPYVRGQVVKSVDPRAGGIVVDWDTDF